MSALKLCTMAVAHSGRQERRRFQTLFDEQQIGVAVFSALTVYRSLMLSIKELFNGY